MRAWLSPPNPQSQRGVSASGMWLSREGSLRDVLAKDQREMFMTRDRLLDTCQTVGQASIGMDEGGRRLSNLPVLSPGISRNCTVSF